MITAIENWGDTGKDVRALPEHITHLQVGEDDFLIATVPDTTDRETRSMLKKGLEIELEIKTIVITESVKLSIISKEDIPNELKKDTVRLAETEGGSWGEIFQGVPSAISKIWEPATKPKTEDEEVRQDIEKIEAMNTQYNTITRQIARDEFKEKWGIWPEQYGKPQNIVYKTKKYENKIPVPTELVAPPVTKYCCMKCRIPLQLHECRPDGHCPVCGEEVTAYREP